LNHLSCINIEANLPTEEMDTARVILNGAAPTANKAQALVSYYKELLSTSVNVKRCKLVFLGQGKTLL